MTTPSLSPRGGATPSLDKLLDGTLLHAFDIRDDRRTQLHRLIKEARVEVSALLAETQAAREKADDSTLIVRFLAANKRHGMIRQDKETILLIVWDRFGFNEWRYESIVTDGIPVLDDQSRATLRDRIDAALAATERAEETP